MAKENLEEIATTILYSGAVSTRDVDAGEPPFVYTSGSRGPCYISIKELSGQRSILKYLTLELCSKISELYREEKFDFICANAVGGVMSGWQLTDDLENEFGLTEGFIPMAYFQEKNGKDCITGIRKNNEIENLTKVMIFDETINSGETVLKSANALRREGYKVDYASCIVSYGKIETQRKLKEENIRLISLITLPDILKIAKEKGIIPQKTIDSVVDYISDPLGWQLKRNFVIPNNQITEAHRRGYVIRSLDPQEAIELGAPREKVKEGVTYWKIEMSNMLMPSR